MRRASLVFLGISLAIAPIAASASERAPAAMSQDENLTRSPVLTIVLVAIVFGALIFLLTKGDNPTSP